MAMKLCEKCDITHNKPTCPLCKIKKEIELKDQQIEQLLTNKKNSTRKK